MSERIIADNLDEVVRKNFEIHDEILRDALLIRTTFNRVQIGSAPQLAMQILKSYGLIQLPIDNLYWSGAIFVKNGKKIPVINTALPRVNQYFTAWHEIYHLILDQVSFNHIIESDSVMEERKADHFSSLMLLGNLMSYYTELPDMDFMDRIFYCMDAFQTPYKAILIALYESATRNGNNVLMERIKSVFDIQLKDLANRFRLLGLDDSLVNPSFVVNVSILQSKIQDQIRENPDLCYNYDNSDFLKTIIQRINLIMGEGK